MYSRSSWPESKLLATALDDRRNRAPNNKRTTVDLFSFTIDGTNMMSNTPKISKGKKVVIISVSYFIFLAYNDGHEGRGGTEARLKKNDGYSRVPLDAVVICPIVSSYFLYCWPSLMFQKEYAKVTYDDN